jgi:transformation/transcription domain-associated protein
MFDVLQIMELQEAAQIHQALQHGRSNSLHDMKATIKTWRNRLPVIADDLSHWSDIFTWRQHHYTFIASHFNAQHDQTVNSTLGVHASAQVGQLIPSSCPSQCSGLTPQPRHSLQC